MILKSMDQVSRLCRMDDQVYCLERWDYGARYIRYFDKLGTIRDIHGHPASEVPRSEPILLAADPTPPEDAFVRVEFTSIQISHLEVWWVAYVKHTSDCVETARVPKKILLDIHRRLCQRRP